MKIVLAKIFSSSGDGAFEFQRTVSRLHKMQSESYIGSQHLS